MYKRQGFVLSKGALTTKSGGEGDIRKALIEARMVDCIVNLPAKLFLNTQIPASLWFLTREKTRRRDEILFIDARNLGHLINRRTLELSEEDTSTIADTYSAWQKSNEAFEDIKGFCKSASVEDVAKLDYVLAPGRYVGLAEIEDDFDFNERFTSLKADFDAQLLSLIHI